MIHYNINQQIKFSKFAKMNFTAQKIADLIGGLLKEILM